MRYRLPHVRPEVARRRRLFFTSVLALVVVGLTTALLHRGTAAAAGNSPERHSQPAQVGCTLRVGTQLLSLDSAMAMTLTDLAGRDQNAAATVQHTAAAVAATWSEHAASADSIAVSLRGYVPAALACTASLPPAAVQPMRPDGLTARANIMWDAVKRIFGPLPAGGFMPGGAHTGHLPGSAHYEGRAIDFLYRPITDKSIRHGWVLAQWLEAHAQQLQIATVIFDAQIWTPGAWDVRGWRTYSYPEGPTTNPTLLHYDHVHVDVQRGT